MLNRSRVVFSSSALADRVAIVTGAQQGIGRSVAEAYAAAGASVVVGYLDNQQAASDICHEIESGGGTAIAVRADVSRMKEIDALFEATIERFGRVDILVNNAGIYPRSPALDMAEEEWHQVIDVNLKGTFFCSQAAARRMCKQGGGGAIINLSSISIRGALNGAHYVASKGGVAAMTRALAFEWGRYGIRVNAIAPGLIDTAQPRIASSAEELYARGKSTPLGRIGETSDIADVSVYLASDASTYITGQILHVNGGAFMF